MVGVFLLFVYWIGQQPDPHSDSEGRATGFEDLCQIYPPIAKGEGKQHILCIPCIVPEREGWLCHSLDSWCTLGGDGTGFAYRNPGATSYTLSKSSSNARFWP